MSNVTLSIDEGLLRRAREMAKAQGTSLNAMIRRLLEERVRGGGEWLEATFALADRSAPRSGKRRAWKRRDLYRV